MDCANLISKLGFECREVADGVIAVATPFSFADGEVISFYVREEAREVSLFDNGDTLFHLRSVGLDLSDRRRWRPYKQIVESFGLTLAEDGEICGRIAPDGVSHLIALYIGAMLEVGNSEREQLGIPPELDQYLQEVEMQLRAWKPQAHFARTPVRLGASGRPHAFSFEFDDKLIEAARPHSNRTGAILRKVADVSLSGNVTQIIVVMDDREDPERAAMEAGILTAMVSVLPFSQLERNAAGLAGVH